MTFKPASESPQDALGRGISRAGGRWTPREAMARALVEWLAHLAGARDDTAAVAGERAWADVGDGGRKLHALGHALRILAGDAVGRALVSVGLLEEGELETAL